MTTPTAPYTVIPRLAGNPDGPVWARGLRTLGDAIRAQRDARTTGLRNIVILGADGREVDETSVEYTEAEESL